MIAGTLTQNGYDSLIIKRLSDGMRVSVSGVTVLDSISWAGDRAIVFETGGKMVIVRITDEAEGLEAERLHLGSNVEVIDPLPNAEDHLLIQMEVGSVHRISISELYAGSKEFGALGSAKRLAKRKDLVAEIDADAVLWVADRDAAVRGALTVECDGDGSAVLELHYRDAADDDWRRIYRSDWDLLSGLPLVPMGFTEDNRDLHVLSNQERDTYALFEFDVDAGELGAVVFEREGVDVIGVIRDYSKKRVLAASYREGGRLKYQHFDRFGNRYQRSLEHAFLGESVAIVSSSRSGQSLVVFVWSARNPGAYYLLDTDNNRARLLDRLSTLEPADLHDVQVLRGRSTDGLMIESFLTLPHGDGLPPLVVMPHGGPIGVNDAADFDPVSQYLAANGFAVLQINYRGSSGYGKAFLQAGRRQWGGLIEDDIDAAMEHAIQTGQVDGDRVCIVGASYGGYSALMSIVRHPRRFRCAATLAGVTDIGLMFNSSDFAQTQSGRDRFAQIVGDPNTEYERLIEISPLYHVSEFQVPVFIAHGWRDQRVDIEHAFRLTAMLDLYGKAYRWFFYDEAKHSLTPGLAADYYEKLVRFLTEHLDTGASAEAP